MTDISLIPKDYKERKISFGAVASKSSFLVVVLVVLSLLFYGGLFFYKKSLSSQFQDLQAKIEEIKGQRDDEFEKKAKSLDVVLKNLNTVLKKHVYWSVIFSKIGELTVPQVSFSNFNGTIEKGGSVSIVLSGKTSGYTYLAKQMKSFSQEELVSDIKVSGIALGTEGGIEFGLNINFSKDILSR